MFMDRGIGEMDVSVVCFVEELVIGRLGHVTEHVKQSGYGWRLKNVGNGKEVASAVSVGRMVDDSLFHSRSNGRPRRRA